MAKVKIDPGACGFRTTVEVKRKDKTTFAVVIESDCEMVKKLGTELPELKMTDVFKRITENPVFVKGAVCLRHVACPVPFGIIKALEVEAGLSVKKDSGVYFISDED